MTTGPVDHDDNKQVSLSATPSKEGAPAGHDDTKMYNLQCSKDPSRYCPVGAEQYCVTMRHNDTNVFCSATPAGTRDQGGKGDN